MPNISNLRVFGCPAYAHIDQSLRSKFGDKSFKCIFVGYAFDSPAWLVFNPSTNRVTRSRNVTFDEAWIPNVESPPHTPIANFDNSDDEDPSPLAAPIPREQQEPALPVPGEQQLPTPFARSLRRVAQLTRDLEAAKTRAEREPRGRAENRRAGITRALEAESALQLPAGQPEDIDQPTTYPAVAEPTSYKRAMTGEHHDDWTLITKLEYASHISKGTWELVARKP